MHCESCGAKLREGAKFCVRCGAKVATVDQPGSSAKVSCITVPAAVTINDLFDLSSHARATEERLPATQLFIDTFGANFELSITIREYEVDDDKYKFQLGVQIDAAGVDHVDDDTAGRLAKLVADIFFEEASRNLSVETKKRLIEAADPVSMFLNDDVIY
jgi:hypothetical protein